MKISVVIAAYNEEKLIGQCLKAVLNQNYAKDNFEVILIDNNSSDNTSQVAEDLGVKPILYSKKQGAIYAKDYAVKQAKGDIIAITDADAVPDRNWLKNIDRKMQDEKIHIAGGRVDSLENSRMAKFLFEASNEFSKIVYLMGIPLIWGSNMGVRKKTFQDVGGLNTALETGDDWEFVLRVQKKYGIRSVLYTDSLRVKVSPRKQDNLKSFIPYFGIAIVNFISIFIFRKSYTVGRHSVVR